MVSKKFRPSPEECVPLASGFGSCLASDRITVDGCRMGYVYREAPDNALDSGWRFLAGDASRAYTDNPKNFELCDVNTVANYDRDILPMLESDPGCAFARTDGGPLLAEAFEPPIDA
jgi:hypothetical protein